MLKLPHPAPGSHWRALCFAGHCIAERSFRQRWCSTSAQRSPQESSFVGMVSMLLPALGKACFGEQQFLGPYSPFHQTASAISSCEPLSSPENLEIPLRQVWKHLTCPVLLARNLWPAFSQVCRPSPWMHHVQPWGLVLGQGGKQWKHTAGEDSITETQSS